jgi:hypothetical protein
MTVWHVTFSLLCATAAFAAGSHAAIAQRPPARNDVVPAATIPFTEWETSTPAPRMPDRIDLRGNPIDHAVGDYRVDPSGVTYETHSPDTSVARLGPAGV